VCRRRSDSRTRSSATVTRPAPVRRRWKKDVVSARILV
jgi:hypothetical protein